MAFSSDTFIRLRGVQLPTGSHQVIAEFLCYDEFGLAFEALVYEIVSRTAPTLEKRDFIGEDYVARD
jgi:hypothetical protein